MHVYPGLLAVIDMEHKNAGYTIIKVSQEHMLAPFFHKCGYSEVILYSSFVSILHLQQSTVISRKVRDTTICLSSSSSKIILCEGVT